MNLNEFEPKEVLRFFYEICSIPHGSGNMEAISNYCVKFAKDRELEVVQDEHLNVIITKEATQGYENEDGIIIQGHMDMVCEKEEGLAFDFAKDALVLESDGTYITAKGTTLGGDDGVAVAIALAVLDSKDLKHPKIEAVFTVDEEVGLVGAGNINLSSVTSRKMINIDSSDEGVITTSCAGGCYMAGDIPVQMVKSSGATYELNIRGLAGGHSGCDIHLGKANSNLLMGRILFVLQREFSIKLNSMDGGKKDNVIPSMTCARILVDGNEEQFLARIKELEAVLREEYSVSDPALAIECVKVEGCELEVLDEKSFHALLNILLNFPNGIQQMSAAISGLVETSLNLGVLRVNREGIRIQYGVRSAKETAKNHLTERLKYAIEELRGTWTEAASYPGWEYKVDSPLRDTFVKVYTEQYGTAPEVSAIHAGLECGLLAGKLPGLDCVAIGPNMPDIHSTNERLEIKSLERTWNLVKAVLAEK